MCFKTKVDEIVADNILTSVAQVTGDSKSVFFPDVHVFVTSYVRRYFSFRISNPRTRETAEG